MSIGSGATAPRFARVLVARMPLAIRAFGGAALLCTGVACTTADRYDVPRPLMSAPGAVGNGARPGDAGRGDVGQRGMSGPRALLGTEDEQVEGHRELP
jgi:hypothetical protein